MSNAFEEYLKQKQTVAPPTTTNAFEKYVAEKQAPPEPPVETNAMERLYKESQERPVKNVILPGEKMAETPSYKYTADTEMRAAPEKSSVTQFFESLFAPWGGEGEKVRAGFKKAVFEPLATGAQVASLSAKGHAKVAEAVGVPKSITEPLTEFFSMPAEYWSKKIDEADRKAQEWDEAGTKAKGKVGRFTASAIAQTGALAPELAKAYFIGEALPSSIVAKLGGDTLKAGMYVNAVSRNVRSGMDVQTAIKNIASEIAPLETMGVTEGMFAKAPRLLKPVGTATSFEAGALGGGVLQGKSQTEEEFITSLASASPFALKSFFSKPRGTVTEKEAKKLVKVQTDKLPPEMIEKRQADKEWEEYQAKVFKEQNEQEALELGITPEQNELRKIVERNLPLVKKQIGQEEGIGSPASKTETSSGGMVTQDISTDSSKNFLRQPEESLTQNIPSENITGVPEGNLKNLGSSIESPPSPETIISEKENVKSTPNAEVQRIGEEPRSEDTLPQGAGAANVAEFNPVAEFETGVKQAQVNLEREQRGRPQLTTSDTRPMEQVSQEAQDIYGNDPEAPKMLLGKIAESKSPVLSDTEVALLGRYRVDVRNELNKATKLRQEAEASGASQAKIDSLRDRENFHSEELNQIDTATWRAGTATARGLAMRRAMFKQDFSLVSLERKAVQAKGGEGLTTDERTKLAGIAKKIKDLEDRIAANDFAPKPKTMAEKKESVAVKMAKIELERAKREFGDAEAKWKWENKAKGEKAMHYVLETLGLPRAIMATMDLSAPGRQGIIHLATPYYWKTAKEMFSWAKSEESAQRADAELATHADYDIAKNAGLEFHDISKQGGAVPEVRVSALPEKFLPGARASNRSYAVFLNVLRMRAFEHFYELTGKDSTKAKAIADFVNKTTGAGNLSGILSPGGQRIANVGFFAPKLAVSRVQSLDPRIYTRMGKEARNAAVKLIVKDVLIGTSVLASIAMGAKMAGRDDVTVGLDPRSADFGKLKVGNTRYDIFGGYSQLAVLFTRLALNATNAAGITDTPEMISSVSGKQMVLGGKYGDPTALQIIGRFVENKQSPFMQWIMLGARKGKTATGEKVNVPGAIIDNFIPMFANDLRDLTTDRNFWQALPMYIPGFFGTGVQTYGEQIPYTDIQPGKRAKTRWRSNPSVGEWIAGKFQKEPVSNIAKEAWEPLRKNRKLKWKAEIEAEKLKTWREKLQARQKTSGED